MKPLSQLFQSSKTKQSQLVHGPIDILISPILQKRLAFFFAFGCLIFCILMQYFFLKELKKPERVFAIDGSQTLHIGPLENLDSNSIFFQNLCILATQCIFQRSPVGLDMEEFLDFIFSEESKKKISEDLNQELDDLKSRNLHQKAEISSIQSFKKNSGVRQFLVKGNLISAGSLNAIPISQSQPFELILNIAKNEKISEQASYPFRIINIHINK